jgi:hypothetical protein
MRHPVLKHLSEHTWLWVAGLAALGLVLSLLGIGTPAALSFMVIGLLVMMKSQRTDILTIITEDPLEDNRDANVGGFDRALNGREPMR